MILSIITINLNNNQGLKDTIQSVIGQSWHEFEFIVIDGGSVDGSLDTIHQFSNRIEHWLSESDSGIYNAMNKGAKLATGDYLLFLNSGDILASEHSLKEVSINALQSEIIYGTIYHKDKSNHIELMHSPAPEDLDISFFFTNSLPHPATLIQRDFFHRMNGYSEQLEIISDWEFLLRALYIEQVQPTQIPVIFAIHSTDGISHNPQSMPKIRNEQRGVFQQYFPNLLSSFENRIQQDNPKTWIALLRIWIKRQIGKAP